MLMGTLSILSRVYKYASKTIPWTLVLSTRRLTLLITHGSRSCSAQQVHHLHLRPCCWLPPSLTTRPRGPIDGPAAVLRQGGREEGAVDAGGGPRPRLLRPGERPRQLARRPQQDRSDAVQQELPAAVDQLPPPGHPPRRLLRPGGPAHRPPPGAPRQPLGRHRVLPPRPHRQRRQELLEHAPQEEAQQPPAAAAAAARRLLAAAAVLKGEVGAPAADRHRPRQASPARGPLRRRRPPLPAAGEDDDHGPGNVAGRRAHRLLSVQPRRRAAVLARRGRLGREEGRRAAVGDRVVAAG